MEKNYPTVVEKAAEIFNSAPERFLNRELSWLNFNKHVLEEAMNEKHPLLERVRFLSISASNLDEFFMVRVAGLNDQVNWGNSEPGQDGLTPAQQLEKILAMAHITMEEQAACWRSLRKLLVDEQIYFMHAAELSADDKSWLHTHFMANIFPALTPIAIDPSHPFPFLSNKSLAAIYELTHARRKKPMMAVLLLPPRLPRLVSLPGNERRFIALEDVITMFIDMLFPGYEMQSQGLFRILRDSDLAISDDAEDLVRTYEKAVKERRRGHVVRLKVNSDMPPHLRDFVSQHLRVPAHYMAGSDEMLGLSAVAELLDIGRTDLKFVPYAPRFPERIDEFNGDCFAAIKRKDILVHHPYESFDVVVQFLRQAAQDEHVVSIKQTLYRTSNDSPIVRALIEAAESGKSVTAVVELRARFDEEANIRLARDLERAGAQVVYGVVGLKTHAKVSLVTRRVEGALENYVHFGTGNYHPITAKTYTDLSFFTCDKDLCLDAAMLFNYLTGYAAPKEFKKLSMSPHTMRKSLLDLIYAEAENAAHGKPAQIWAKMNSLVDPEMIDALYYASQCGVKIQLVVRGICCLRPGVKGFSENISVKSIIGRFLEHSRIFCFASGYDLPSPKAKVYISSADWMPRNLDYRVEYMAPIENSTVHEQVMGQIMVANFSDDLQSWNLLPDGSSERVKPKGDGFSAHEYFMRNPSLSGRGRALKNKNKPPKLYQTRRIKNA